jgi:hypothetical protein
VGFFASFAIPGLELMKIIPASLTESVCEICLLGKSRIRNGLGRTPPKFSPICEATPGGNMHKTFLMVAAGAALALFLNKTIAGIVNSLLSPLGATYV